LLIAYDNSRSAAQIARAGRRRSIQKQLPGYPGEIIARVEHPFGIGLRFTMHRHQCFVYEGSPSRNLPAVMATIKQRLKENHRCLYLDSPPMVAGMRSYLAAADVDVAGEVGKKSLVLSSDQQHLVAGRFDVERMMQTLNDALDQALRDGYDGLWATGDMTWEFGPKQDFSKLMEYEWRLEEFMRAHASLSGLCIYHADTLPRAAMLQGFMTHECVFINETLSKINPNYVPRELFTNEAIKSAELKSTLDSLYGSGQTPSN
jgi:hypothetical protein